MKSASPIAGIALFCLKFVILSTILFQDGKLPIDRLTSHQITFDELNEAFDRMADGSSLRQVMVL